MSSRCGKTVKSVNSDSENSTDSGSSHTCRILKSRKDMEYSRQDKRFSGVSNATVKFEQEHGRPRMKVPSSSSSLSAGFSNTSLSSSITRFRNDFEELKCKMKIFGESLNLCRCIANDFQNKLQCMENRLQSLEKRERMHRNQSNYSAIIKKNKRLSYKTLQDAKKLQMCGTEEEMREVAARICRNYLHGAWKTVEPSQLDFRRVSGGLSNFLYYVALPEDLSVVRTQALRDNSPENETKVVTRSNSLTMDEPRRVLLRIYGQVHGERAMDAIVTESVIFTLLSERRLGPKLHGVFSGGRIEEYIPARPLLTKELGEPALSMKIAEKMAAIHSMDVPLSKEPNWLWKTMVKWMKTISSDGPNLNSAKNEEEVNIIKRLKAVDFEKELDWLKKFTATVDCPVVFCHNDMQEGNILLLEDSVAATEEDDATLYVHPFSDTESAQQENTPLSVYEDANTSDSVFSRVSDTGEPRLVLIDYEYCAYNYRAFDIANHFQEWGYDYTNPHHPFYYENQENCPTLEQKEIFIREYLKHYNANTSASPYKDVTPSIDEVNKLLAEVDVFALASHLLWCLWSMVNVSKSQIPFGYLEYALSRLETYFRLKQEVVKKDKFGYPQKRKIYEVDI